MGEFCEAVELLLARMDSNPEEFTEGGRWERLITKYRSCLPVADQLALTGKINTLRMDTFHKEVMKELLAEPREPVDPVIFAEESLGALLKQRYAEAVNVWRP
jgi:hypothetical protein